MAKEEKREGEHHGGGEKSKPKKHLHEIRTTEAEDGSYVHHHTYKAKKENHNTERERENVATSATPEEAGQHVAEQFGMNQQEPEAEPEEPEAAPEGGEPAPAAGAPAMAGGMPGQ
jgi:hypothetical protein